MLLLQLETTSVREVKPRASSRNRQNIVKIRVIHERNRISDSSNSWEMGRQAAANAVNSMRNGNNTRGKHTNLKHSVIPLADISIDYRTMTRSDIDISDRLWWNLNFAWKSTREAISRSIIESLLSVEPDCAREGSLTEWEGKSRSALSQESQRKLSSSLALKSDRMKLL